MKRSKYTYFFKADDEYVGYSWLGNDFASFHIDEKKKVKVILGNPARVITNHDVEIYKELLRKRVLIPDNFDEFRYLLSVRNKAVYRTDVLSLGILPTMNCNCRCPYCYELHTHERMKDEVIENLKSLIKDKINKLSTLYISWFGGESLLEINTIEEISGFCLMLCKKYNVDYRSDITTNGVLLNEKKRKVLNNANIREIQVTLEGSKDRHDKTRVTAGNKGTYDTIVSNIKEFIKLNALNRVTIRIHVHSTDSEEIKGIEKTIDLFKDYKENVYFYFRKIFTSCTDRWEVDCTRKSLSDNNGKDLKDDIILELLKKINASGFRTPPIIEERKFTFCEAERDSSWFVRPDGYLNKCSLAIEKERSQAILTKKGIIPFIERLIPWNIKILTARLEHCKECSILPICWGLCAYNNYQNPDKTVFYSLCEKKKEDKRTKEVFLAYKDRYMRLKRDKDANK